MVTAGPPAFSHLSMSVFAINIPGKLRHDRSAISLIADGYDIVVL
jgi:hypothetical protein